MSESVIKAITDPAFVVALLVAIAVFATLLTLLPALGGNSMKSRMKAVALEREELRAKQKARLAAESDRRVTLAGLKLARHIAEQPSFKPLIRNETIPGLGCKSDEDFMQFARERGTTVFHPCGTCKMGNDPMAVVDARLRVHGIGGLRVIDASIMPNLVSGNTNAPTIMIAEKASDMIKVDARA